MNEFEALHDILAAAIARAQAHGIDASKHAEDAAKAFKAGLAAFVETNEHSPVCARDGCVAGCNCLAATST